jgi:hypothetical protein
MKKEIFQIPTSDNVISRRIQDMSPDAESQVIANIKQAFFLAIQFDKPTGKAQLLVFSRVICDGDITEQLFFCKPLAETTVISVLAICHGNHAAASARTLLSLCREA